MSVDNSSLFADLTQQREIFFGAKHKVSEIVNKALDSDGLAYSYFPPSSPQRKPELASEVHTIAGATLLLENSNFEDYALLSLDQIGNFSPLLKLRGYLTDTADDPLDDIRSKSNACLLQYMVLRQEQYLGMQGKLSSKFDFRLLYAGTWDLARKLLESIGKPSWHTDLESLQRNGVLYFRVYRCLQEFEALLSTGDLNPKPGGNTISDVSDAIESLVALSSNITAHLICNYHSGAQQAFDAVSAVHWLCILCDQRATRQARKAQKHLLLILLRDDLRRYSVSGPHVGSVELTTANLAPTTMELLGRLAWLARHIAAEGETLALSLSCIRDQFDWLSGELDDLVNLTSRRSIRHVSAFYALCETWFFVTQSWLLLDEALNVHSRKSLGVGRPIVDEIMKKRSYPAGMQDFMRSSVINKIKGGGGGRQTAFFSMLLYGPPGTAKTTFARKIAFDLGWPLLEIGQKDFLGEGMDRIEGVAENLFANLMNLRDVVVLFDELEEMIIERLDAEDKESRLITTSMLPRIQRLRESKRVVFIFATNSPDKVDAAVRRIGRFDIVKYVELPSASARITRLRDLRDELPKEYEKAKAALSALLADEPRLAELTKYMTYADIDHFVRRLTNADAAGGEISENAAKTIFGEFTPPKAIIEIVERCELMKRFDRPGETLI